MQAADSQTTDYRDGGTARRARPAWLRALGSDDPPLEVAVDGIVYRRVEVFKHDSWAATGLYASSTGRVICKFNRRQSLLGLPGAWIGRVLARREAYFLRRLADVPLVPRVLGPVVVGGSVAPNAVARSYIEGNPLGPAEKVDDAFFPQLVEVLRSLHDRGIAYVDLHKHENVLVGADGRPYLIDFQVCFASAPEVKHRGFLSNFVLRLLQRMDEYHVAKLQWRFRPDLSGLTYRQVMALRPGIVRAHRVVAVPLRNARRKLLTWLGVRRGRGRAQSEQFVEAGLREPRKAA